MTSISQKAWGKFYYDNMGTMWHALITLSYISYRLLMGFPISKNLYVCILLECESLGKTDYVRDYLVEKGIPRLEGLKVERKR